MVSLERFSPTVSQRRNPVVQRKTAAMGRTSKDSLRMLHISRRSYSGQGEVEAVLILVSYRAESQAAVFDAQATAVPVVGGLDTAILQGILDEVIAGVDAGAQPALRRVSIPQKQ
jgi:ribosomal protein S2